MARLPSNKRDVKGREWKIYKSRISGIGRQNERLNKIRVHIDFVHSLQSFLPAAYNTSQAGTHPSKPSNVCHLLNLPAELRTVIYEHLLVKSWTVHLFQQQYNQRHERKYVPCRGPKLLHVSAQIRHEALPIYFQANEFVLRTPLVAINHAASWLETIIELCGRSPFNNLPFHIHAHPWSQFPRVEHLVQLIASGVLKLDVSRVDLNAHPLRLFASMESRRLFTMDQQSSSYVQRALEEAVFIGTVAREQGWNPSRVSWQFEVLMALKMPVKRLAAYVNTKKSREHNIEQPEDEQ